jgi:large subunit ribosomal protein L9
MNVILLKDVEKVGLRGDVVSVARGYARNYLFPRKLAEQATAARVAELEKRDSQRARHEAKTADEATSIATKLAATELRFEMKAGPTGSLFGSVTPTDIADELWTTSKILFQDVRVEVKLVVVPEGGELPSDDELEAMEAVERAEQEAAAPAVVEEPVYEYIDDEPATPAAEAAAQDSPGDGAEPEPEWRADADEALRQK